MIKIIVSYKEKMIKLFKTMPTLLLPKQCDDYKTKYKKNIKAVGGKWYIDNINDKQPTMNII